MTFSLAKDEVARLARLLQMEYRVRELADEVRCSQGTIRAAIKAGCPHRRDEAERIWVVGTVFTDWYMKLLATQRQKLGPGEVYCLHCRAVVPFAPQEQRVLVNGTDVMSGVCSVCGMRVNRFGKEMR